MKPVFTIGTGIVAFFNNGSTTAASALLCSETATIIYTFIEYARGQTYNTIIKYSNKNAIQYYKVCLVQSEKTIKAV